MYYNNNGWGMPKHWEKFSLLWTAHLSDLVSIFKFKTDNVILYLSNDVWLIFIIVNWSRQCIYIYIEPCLSPSPFVEPFPVMYIAFHYLIFISWNMTIYLQNTTLSCEFITRWRSFLTVHEWFHDKFQTNSNNLKFEFEQFKIQINQEPYRNYSSN